MGREEHGQAAHIFFFFTALDYIGRSRANLAADFQNSDQNVRASFQRIGQSIQIPYLKGINFRGAIISRGFEFAVFIFAVLQKFSYFQPTFQHFLPNFVVFSPYFDIFLLFSRYLFSRRSQPRKLVHREN